MPLFDNRITHNHFYGNSENFSINPEGGEFSGNKIKIDKISFPKKPALEKITRIYSIVSQFIAPLAVAYIVYKLGWN